MGLEVSGADGGVEVVRGRVAGGWGAMSRGGGGER